MVFAEIREDGKRVARALKRIALALALLAVLLVVLAWFDPY